MKKLLVSLSSSFAVFALVSTNYGSYFSASTNEFLYSTFNSNLGEGRYLSSADAQALTTALSNAGLWNANTPINNIYRVCCFSGIRDSKKNMPTVILTPNGLSYGTGFVGASTRAELIISMACSTNSTPPTTFQCPAGYTLQSNKSGSDLPIGYILHISPGTPQNQYMSSRTMICNSCKQLPHLSRQLTHVPQDILARPPNSHKTNGSNSESQYHRLPPRSVD